MFLKAYVLLDAKTGAHSQPMFFATDGAAVRSVIEIGLDPNTMIGRHPSDFVLYCVGGFEDSTGMLHPGEFVSFGSVASLLPRSMNAGAPSSNGDEA